MNMYQVYRLCHSQCFNSIRVTGIAQTSEIETLHSSLEFQFIGQAELLLSPGKFLKRHYSQSIPCLSIHDQIVILK